MALVLQPGIVLLVMGRSRGAWILVLLIGATGSLLGLPLRIVDAQRVAVTAELTVLAAIAGLLWARARRQRRREARALRGLT